MAIRTGATAAVMANILILAIAAFTILSTTVIRRPITLITRNHTTIGAHPLATTRRLQIGRPPVKRPLTGSRPVILKDGSNNLIESHQLLKWNHPRWTPPPQSHLSPFPRRLPHTTNNRTLITPLSHTCSLMLSGQ